MVAFLAAVVDGVPAADDQIDLALHRLGGERGKSLVAAFLVQIIDREVLALDPAPLAQVPRHHLPQ